MENKYRIFCPKDSVCTKDVDCSACVPANNNEDGGGDDELQHTINRRFLVSIGRVCLCSDCADV